MSDFTIEKNVPVQTRGAYASYPFADMEIGDSFLVSAITASESLVADRRLRSAASAHGRQNSKKFVVRVVEGGVRCWRTK